MKKYLYIVLAAIILLNTGQVMAEMSAQGYTGKRYEEQQVFVVVYNNSSASVSANSAVVIDTTATDGSTLGAYINTSTTADSVYAFGVTGETIASGVIGKVCVRGPIPVYVEATAATQGSSPIVAGDIVSVGNDAAGSAQEYATSDGTAGGQLGVALESASSGIVTIWVNPQIHK